MPANNVVLVGSFTANEDTKYTVEHYLQNLDGETYTIDSTATETKTGTTGAQTAAVAKTYLGFTAQEFNQEVIAGDGSTVVRIYYDRNPYTLTIHYVYPDGSTAADDYVATLKYQEDYNVASPDIKGYVPDQAIVDGEMPVHDVEVTVVYATGNETGYKVNYYYQNDEGSYDLKRTDSLATTTGVLVFADTTPNKDHGITTPSMYQFNPAGRTMDADDNVVNTLVQARVAADGSTVLNVFFDQVYRIVYMYTNGATTTYVINDTGYIYKQDSEFRPPTLDWGAEIGTNFDGVWYDNNKASGEAWATWTIAGSMETVAFDAATNTITLYTTEKAKPVTPFTKGLLNVAKVVNDGGKKTDGTEEFKFELKILEIKQAQQEFAPLSSDEAEKLHHYNSENINAQSANDKAQENLLNAEHKFKGNALTTASALSFVIAADDNTALFGVTTGSEMGWTSYDEWNTYVFEGDGIAELSVEETVLDKMIEFIRIFAEQGRTMPTTEENTKLFMDDMMDYAGVATGSAIMFHHADLYDLDDAAATAAMTSAAADKKATALEEFLKEINRWVDPVVNR